MKPECDIILARLQLKSFSKTLASVILSRCASYTDSFLPVRHFAPGDIIVQSTAALYMTERGMINYTLTHLPLAWSTLRGTHPCVALIRAVSFYEREHRARMHQHQQQQQRRLPACTSSGHWNGKVATD